MPILSFNNITTTLNNGLYAVYKAESNANDSLGTYNGTAVGGLTYSGGKSGNAFLFNGTNSFVSLNNNSMNFTGDYSLSCWVYIPSGYIGTSYIYMLTNWFATSWANNIKGWAVRLNGNNFDFLIGDGTSFNGNTGLHVLSCVGLNHIHLVRGHYAHDAKIEHHPAE